MKKMTLFVALFAAITLSAQEPEWVAKIEIAGQQITSLNCQNLHELLNATQYDKKKEMSVTFDREKSVLLFRNADIRWYDVQNRPFLNVDENLTIVAEGDNTVEMESAKYFIVAKSDVTIQAANPDDDKLIAYGISWGQVAEDAPYSGIFVFLDGNVNLTINSINFCAHYFVQGIVGANEATNKVKFDKTSFYAAVSNEVTKEINEINLIGCEIKRPAGAAFSPELKGFAKDGKLVAGEKYFLISPISEAIDNPMVNGSQNGKFFRDGQLYLMYEGRMYDVRGARVE